MQRTLLADPNPAGYAPRIPQQAVVLALHIAWHWKEIIADAKAVTTIGLIIAFELLEHVRLEDTAVLVHHFEAAVAEECVAFPAFPRCCPEVTLTAFPPLNHLAGTRTNGHRIVDRVHGGIYSASGSTLPLVWEAESLAQDMVVQVVEVAHANAGLGGRIFGLQHRRSRFEAYGTLQIMAVLPNTPLAQVVPTWQQKGTVALYRIKWFLFL